MRKLGWIKIGDEHSRCLVRRCHDGCKRSYGYLHVRRLRYRGAPRNWMEWSIAMADGQYAEGFFVNGTTQECKQMATRVAKTLAVDDNSRVFP